MPRPLSFRADAGHRAVFYVALLQAAKRQQNATDHIRQFRSATAR
jgi:hypothetical protein